MSGMILDGLQFFFEDARGRRVLLADAGDFTANESRALLHYIDDEYVWVMRDNIKNITEYIEREKESGASLHAALAVLVVRALWGKQRPRRILWMGTFGRTVISVAKMAPIFHEQNRLYCVASDFPDVTEENIVPIRANCRDIPLPEDKFDIVVVDAADVAPDRMVQIALSLRVGGVLIVWSPAGTEVPFKIPQANVFFDDEGNAIAHMKISKEITAILRERTQKRQLSRQKRLVTYILDEVGEALASMLISGDDERLEDTITKASLAEENILPIYEELVSEDVKYLANRFKESLIEFRLHKSEETRACVLEDYLALRREMKDQDDF
ncbi:MAG: hypothetical protein K5982_04030 [Selenomonadaceae bacterium]|nr:hypothetical protein [Selenomonadaceae bacterium]